MMKTKVDYDKEEDSELGELQRQKMQKINAKY